MSITLAALLVAIVGLASANNLVMPSNTAALSGVSGSHITLSSGASRARTYMSYTAGYNWHVYYYHGTEYVYEYSSCSTPPSSIMVCLSTIFTSIEADLAVIEKSLKAHEGSVHGYFESEFNALKTEMADVSQAKKVAAGVKNVVSENYEMIEEEISALNKQKVQIKAAKAMFAKEQGYLVSEINGVEAQINELVSEYGRVKSAKWTLVSQINVIEKQKALVVKEQADVEAVVSDLDEQIDKIAEKISQMNKRQVWMASWENKMSLNLRGFATQINEFKQVEQELDARETYLKSEQANLNAVIMNLKAQIQKLQAHYKAVSYYLEELVDYEERIEDYKRYISVDATEFQYALSEFTCEEYVLYYEACNSPAPAPAPAAAAAKPAAPTAAKPAAAPAKPAAGAKAMA